MMVAPPLILLGAPLIPLVRGLPVFAAREFAGPFLNWRVAPRIGNALIHPAVALLLMGTADVRLAHAAAVRISARLEFMARGRTRLFLPRFADLLVAGHPAVAQPLSLAALGRVVPYLIIGDLQNTALSAILVFSDRVIYPSYASMPRLFGFSGASDQAAAGAIMWVIGGFAFVVPAPVIALQCLQAGPRTQPVRRIASRSPRLDALVSLSRRLSFADRLLRRRWSTRTVEAISFLLIFAAMGLGLAHLASGSSDDDDQVLRLHRQSRRVCGERFCAGRQSRCRIVGFQRAGAGSRDARRSAGLGGQPSRSTEQ